MIYETNLIYEVIRKSGRKSTISFYRNINDKSYRHNINVSHETFYSDKIVVVNQYVVPKKLKVQDVDFIDLKYI